jgi:DNA-binding transcriptional LysR family regulator
VLPQHPLLTVPRGAPESEWFARLSGEARPALVCTLTLALVHAAKAGAGIAVLPRYLGDAEPELAHLPMPDEPRETLWLTVHKDLRSTPRVRALLDHLSERFTREADDLRGKARD